MIDDLIYDVGMNNGDDTAYYLHKGFRVLAIEANPILTEAAQARFHTEIAQGRLTILAVGIAEQEGEATFWINDEVSEFSSFLQSSGCRENTVAHPVTVPCVTFTSVLATYGVPYYLKIDIEGFDMLCIDALSPNHLPGFVSLEGASMENLLALQRLGYNAFKCIDQRTHNNPREYRYTALSSRLHRLVFRLKSAVRKNTYLRTHLHFLRKQRLSLETVNARSDGKWVFPWGSSGPFGDETPGEWKNFNVMAYELLHLSQGHPELSTIDPDS